MAQAWRKAWLGLGGNIGDVEANMRRALELLSDRPEIHLTRVSPLYATPPWGLEEQPDFLNASAEICSCLPAEELLEACLATERELKRVRQQRWGPRTIDIDILAMEGAEVTSQRLTVPHPRLTERAFALVPLADLAPELIIAGRPVHQWLQGMDSVSIEMKKLPEDWFPAA